MPHLYTFEEHPVQSDEDRQRFELEAKAAGGLKRANISTIHVIEEFENEIYPVNELNNSGVSSFLILNLVTL